MKNLIDTKYWLFDLDNTLYSGQTKVFSEVDKKMSSFISKKFNVDLIKAREIQKEYFYEYGTTLSGLMNHDKIDPHEFLEFVHDIDISWLPKDELLREELIKIKEKKYISMCLKPCQSDFLQSSLNSFLSTSHLNHLSISTSILLIYHIFINFKL